MLAKVTIFTCEQIKRTATTSLEDSLHSLAVSNENHVIDSQSIDQTKDLFDINNIYLYVDEISPDEHQQRGYFAILEFEKPILTPPNSLIIGSKLDTNIHSASCRLAFHGHIQCSFTEKNYDLSSLKIYKIKTKSGQIDRVVNSNEIICKNLFGKNQLHYVEEMFLNFKILLSSGESGFIENTFGKSGKIKVRLNSEIQAESKNATVELIYRKFLFHKKKISQY